MVTEFEESFEYDVVWEASARRDRDRLVARLSPDAQIHLADRITNLRQSHVANTQEIKDRKTRTRGYRIVLGRHQDLRLYYRIEGRILVVVRLEAKKGQKIRRSSRKILGRA